jgi:hypothetical protein
MHLATSLPVFYWHSHMRRPVIDRREVFINVENHKKLGIVFSHWWYKSNITMEDFILLILPMGVDTTETQDSSIICLRSVVSTIINHAQQDN